MVEGWLVTLIHAPFRLEALKSRLSKDVTFFWEYSNVKTKNTSNFEGVQ